MIIRHVDNQNFRDRSGQRTLFAEGIDYLGKVKYGNSWQAPLSIHGPVELPSEKSKASRPDLYYAADLISFFHPGIEIKQTHIEFNDSCPSCYDQFDLEIDSDLWNFAHIKSKEIKSNQLECVENVKTILDEFSDKAVKGEIVCYGQHRHNLEVRTIDRRAWNVGARILWSRYVSGSMDIFEPGVSTDNGKYLIFIESDYLTSIEILDDNQKSERIQNVKRRLLEAAQKSPNFAPHNGLEILIPDVADHLGIPKREADDIVRSTPGNNWGGSGKPKKADKNRAKGLRVTPPYPE